jgi:hypothetical protein
VFSLYSVVKLFLPADDLRGLASGLNPDSMLPFTPLQAQENTVAGIGVICEICAFGGMTGGSSGSPFQITRTQPPVVSWKSCGRDLDVNEPSFEGPTPACAARQRCWPKRRNWRAWSNRRGRGRRRRPQQAQTLPPAEAMLTVDPERVRVQEAREAGAVHVGHRMWERLGRSEVLAAGLPERGRR